jgi:hypothetical protein
MIPAPSCAAPTNNHRRMCHHNHMQPPSMCPPRGNVNTLPCQARPSEYPRPPIPGETNTHPETRVKQLKKVNINIATLNINGATSHNVPLLSKWSEISSTLYEHKIAILAIQETHINQQITDQVLPPRQAAKLSRCGCNPSWFCSPHDACFIHESCLCEGSSKWPPVKPVQSCWVSESHEWLVDILSCWLLPPSSS